MRMRSKFFRRLEGHRSGGPLFLPLLLLSAAGCASGGAVTDRAGPEEQALLRPLQVFTDLGMVAGNESFPAVGSFATLAGPADSTFVLFALSLPNSALRFQREGDGFVGEYAVSLRFLRDTVEVKRIERQERVRIGSFAETGRTEESVVFQTAVPLEPGTYRVEVSARDALSSRGFERSDSLHVPSYGGDPAMLSEPLLVYRADPRNGLADPPRLIANPRHTVPYGDAPPLVYLEAYGERSAPAVIRVLDSAGEELWRGTAELSGGGGRVRHALVELPTEPLPIGRAWIETGFEGDSAGRRIPLLVSISDQWMVSNFDEALEFMTYIASPQELDSLKAASGAARRELWEAFWRRRDPVPATPTNEFRDQFFERVRVATTEFAEAGEAGWRTDRGEVFIVLGAPTAVFERRLGREQTVGRPNAIEWLYEGGPGGRTELLFIDRNGFGRYELTQQSAAEFRRVADRLRPRRSGS